MLKLICIYLSLTGILHSVAQVDYEEIRTYCDTENADEDSMTLYGDEVFYADFEKKQIVNTLPQFAVPITWPESYELAVQDITIYKHNLDLCKKAFKNPPEAQEPPMSSIYPRDEVKVGTENTLICHVTGFYPPPVRVRWTKNNRNVTLGLTLSRYHMNRDDTFNVFSTLKFTPEEGDIYTCTVEHSALDEPLTREWDVEVSEPSVGPTVFCGVGLTLGMLGVATGTFFLIKGNQCNQRPEM